jgi:hypothetical protein
LAPLRSLGPLWLAFALFALLVPQSRANLRHLWSQRLVRRWTYAIAGSLAFAVGWVVYAGAGELVAPPAGKFHYGVGQATLIYIDSWEIFLKGMVGVAGWFDIFMTTPFYWFWIGAAGCLIMLALIISGWADRWRFFVLFVGGAVVPGILQVSQRNVTGFIIGGRYMLPLLVGMPLLAAFIIERRLFTDRYSHTTAKLFCLLLLPSHLALLIYAMVRWQKGAYQGKAQGPALGRMNPLTGDWHPPTGSVLPLITMVAGLALLGVLFWRGPALAAAETQAREEADRPAPATPVETAAEQGLAGDRLPAPEALNGSRSAAASGRTMGDT